MTQTSLLRKLLTYGAFSIGFSAAEYGLSKGLSAYWAQPDAVMYQEDLNSDGRNDYVVTTKDGKRYAFITQENGSYKTPDQIQKEADSTLKAQMKSLQEKLK